MTNLAKIVRGGAGSFFKDARASNKSQSCNVPVAALSATTAAGVAGISELDNWPNLFGARPLCGAEPSSKAAITRGHLPPILRFGLAGIQFTLDGEELHALTGKTVIFGKREVVHADNGRVDDGRIHQSCRNRGGRDALLET